MAVTELTRLTAEEIKPKIGSRILLLSPHPGQVKAEINSVPRGQENSNEGATLSREIHDMLFADQIEETPNA